MRQFLNSAPYMIVDRINKRIIVIESCNSNKVATGYTPSLGNVSINLNRLIVGLKERRYRFKLMQ